MITVDPAHHNVNNNPEYYVMKHFSHFVTPGSYRIGQRGHWFGNAVSFETPNGERIVVMVNPFKEARTVRISDGSAVYEFKLEAESFNTIVFDK